MNDLVSIVIPTCGKNEYYLACLESIKRQTHQALEVFLVNNASDQALAQKARGAYPPLCVYQPPNNLYYCDSMNKGIELSRGDFVLCLNDDVTLDACFIEKSLKGFKKAGRVGMVSGKILRQDRQTIDSAGLFLTAYRTAKERGYGTPDRGQFEKEEFVFGVSGAAAFYRREMLDDIRLSSGWFDPGFRIFYEDLDMAWRANRRGWKAYYIPGALAYHVRGGSVRKGDGAGKSFARQYLSDELQVDLIKNRYLMMLRNETAMSFLGCLIPIGLHDICAWGYVLLFRRQMAGKVWVALAKALRSRPRVTPFREAQARNR